MKVLKCPNCGEEIFCFPNNQTVICQKCGKKYKNPYYDPESINNEINNSGNSENKTEINNVENNVKEQEIDSNKKENNQVNQEIISNNSKKEVKKEINKKVDENISKKQIQPVAQNNKVENAERQIINVITNTIKEFFQFKQFKRIPLALAIIAGILLSPFLIIFTSMIPIFYIFDFVIRLIAAPSDYLTKCIRNEGNSNAVKCVVYLVGYPMVFIFKIAISFVYIEVFVLYFFFQLFGFIYGCGGIKFQPYIFDASMDCSRHLKGKASTSTIVAISIVCVSLLASYIGAIIGVAIDNNSYSSSTRRSTSTTTNTTTDTLSKRILVSYSSSVQEKEYTFTPSYSDYYDFSIENNREDTDIYVYVDDELLGALVNATEDYWGLYLTRNTEYNVVIRYLTYDAGYTDYYIDFKIERD